VNWDCANVPTLVVTLILITSPESMLVVVGVVVPARVMVTALPFGMIAERATLAFAVQAVVSLAVTPVELAVVVTPVSVETITLPVKPAFDDIPDS